MARMPRVVIPGYPHHITQRGNRRQTTFFSEDDYAEYLQLLAAAKTKAEVSIWAYCLMPNHVHLVVVPEREDSLIALFKNAHRKYSRLINRRNGWTGHLWQERFNSVVMDERHLLTAVRYIELNPVRAGLCAKPQAWAWSSVHAHLQSTDDSIVTVQPMLERISDWTEYLATPANESELEKIRSHQSTGRPVGSDDFILRLEKLTGRRLRRMAPGRKKKN